MGKAKSFDLPEDGQTYIEDIINRCEDLISHHIWDGLHLSRLRSWLGNFKTDRERYFAACLLDSLIYRSNDQTLALINQLFQRALPDLTRLQPTPLGVITDWQHRLQSPLRTDPGVRLVVAVKRSDAATKSAHEIARFMKRHFAFREKWIVKPWEVKACAVAGVSVFVFIDDFLGTGDQFERLIRRERLGRFLNRVYAVYAPLVAHENGLQRLRRKFPRLRLTAVERLDSTYGVFQRGSSCFDDGTNTPEIAKQFYYRLLRVKGITVSNSDRRGHGDLELLYAFEHAAPNNSIPLLWWSSTRTFRPLFDR